MWAEDGCFVTTKHSGVSNVWSLGLHTLPDHILNLQGRNEHNLFLWSQTGPWALHELRGCSKGINARELHRSED